MKEKKGARKTRYQDSDSESSNSSNDSSNDSSSHSSNYDTQSSVDSSDVERVNRLRKSLGEDQPSSSDVDRSSGPSAPEGAKSRYPLRDKSKVPFVGP